MLRLILFGIISLIILSAHAEKKIETRTIHLEGLGNIIGEKYWDGEYYEFFGVPYATAPQGRDRYKAPLPPTAWEEDMEAKRAILTCQQVYRSDPDDDDEEEALYGVEDCLTASYMIPKLASKTNLVPIIVYVHSGGFAGGSGNMAKYYHLARQDVLVVNFNYRVGALGFACLGTEDIPGNAAIKDIIAVLKFIKKYAKTLGGDPDNVTLAGFSVGAALAELVALTEESRGLFNKLSLDSGSALSPFAVNRHPIETAINIVKGIGYKGRGNIEDLNEFLLEVDIHDLLSHSRHFFLKNSTFGFAPCIENPSIPGAVLTESPLDTLKKGKYGDFALLTGFANMEGISRTSMFDEWRGLMNTKFEGFLPADLVFDNVKEKEQFIEEIKKHYFNSKTITVDFVQNYIDYFSDSMFKYSILKSAKLHAENLKRPIFLYEFTYVGKLNTKHAYSDRVRGASHRDASAYVLDFYDWTRNYTDLDMRDHMTAMWADFMKFENPTPYETALNTIKWLKYTNKNVNYLDIGDKLEMKKDPFSKGFQLWDKVYETKYWTPTAVNPDPYKGRPKVKHIFEKKVVEKKRKDDDEDEDEEEVSNAENKKPTVKSNLESKDKVSTANEPAQSVETKPDLKKNEKPASGEAKETKKTLVDTKPDPKSTDKPTANAKQENKERVKK